MSSQIERVEGTNPGSTSSANGPPRSSSLRWQASNSTENRHTAVNFSHPLRPLPKSAHISRSFFSDRTYQQNPLHPLPPLPPLPDSEQHDENFTSIDTRIGEIDEDGDASNEESSDESLERILDSSYCTEHDEWDVDGYMQEIEQYIARVGEYVGDVALDSRVASETNHYLEYRRAEASQRARDADTRRRVFQSNIYTGVESADEAMLPTPRYNTLPSYNKRDDNRNEWTQKDIEDYYPRIKDPKDPARILRPKDITVQRAVFLSIVVVLNAGALTAALVSRRHLWVLVFILFIKAKDCLSVILVAMYLLFCKIRSMSQPPTEVPPQWILSLIPTYSETEEQIVKTVYSLRDNGVSPHQQVICIIIDGKPRNIRSHLTRIVASFKRPYVTSKFSRGQLNIDAGFMEDVPVVIFEKIRNAGKKDSLILCHDIFNHPRENMPLYSKLLRTEIWHNILPELTYGRKFSRFDMIFCTDADSVIHDGAVSALADGLIRDRNCIAACGLVLVEFELGKEWSCWNLYQQFQYSFGQFIRRRAESVWGKVTCLPGCITMISVRPEMAGAITKYAEPVTAYPSKRLTTAFVPKAISETVAPLSLRHYLSQRRRWGSNAYFNNIFYCFGSRMSVITRVASCMELVRLTMVYYRLANTIMFLYGLGTNFQWIEILPLVIVTMLPTLWFAFTTIVLEKDMRKRTFKLFLGFCINRCIAPLVSVTVFTKVATSLGSQVWGITGGAAASKQAVSRAAQAVQDNLMATVAHDGRRATTTTLKMADARALVRGASPGDVIIFGRNSRADNGENEVDNDELTMGLPIAELPEADEMAQERGEKLAGLLP